MNINNWYEKGEFEKIIALENKINSNNEEHVLLLTKAHFKLQNFEQTKKLIKKFIHEHKYYYDYLCLKIDILMLEEKYLDAAIILKEELNMPYIEEKYRVKFENDFQTILEKKYKKELSVQDIEQLLFSSLENQILGITLLKKQNIREYFDIITKVLSSNKHSLKVKNLLLMTMDEQGYETKIEFVHDDYFELISVTEHVELLNDLVHHILNSQNFDNPSFENIHKEITTTVVINTFPQDITKEQYVNTIKALTAQMFNEDVNFTVNMELLDYFKSLVY